MKLSPVIRLIVGSYLVSIITFESVIRSALRLSYRAEDKAIQTKSSTGRRKREMDILSSGSVTGDDQWVTNPLSGGDYFFRAKYLANVAAFLPGGDNEGYSTDEFADVSLSRLSQISRGCRDATRVPLEERKAQKKERKAQKIAEVLEHWKELRLQQKEYSMALTEADDNTEFATCEKILDELNLRVRQVEEDADNLGIRLPLSGGDYFNMFIQIICFIVFSYYFIKSYSYFIETIETTFG